MERNVAELLKSEILSLCSYHNLTEYPASVEQLETLDEVITWLGTTDFSSTHSGEYAAILQLLRVVNTLQYQHNLLQFAEWVKKHPEWQTEFVVAHVDRLMKFVEHERRQDAFELALAIASNLSDFPHFREQLATWTRQQLIEKAAESGPPMASKESILPAARF